MPEDTVFEITDGMIGIIVHPKEETITLLMDQMGDVFTLMLSPVEARGLAAHLSNAADLTEKAS